MVFLSKHIRIFHTAKTCPALVGLENATVFGPPSIDGYFHHPDVVLILCNYGFAINGPDSLLCLADGTWSDQEPTCEGKTQDGLLLLSINIWK